jgi:hypothetical protein
MASPGRKAQISKEKLGRPAISKAMKRFGLREKDVLVPGSENQTGDESIESDLNKTLIQMNANSIRELGAILKELGSAKISEKGKLRDTYTKLSQEVRQQIRDLNTLTEKFNEREIIFHFFAGIAKTIREEVPPDIRKKVFNRILVLRNAYSKMNEVKVELEEKECPNSE